MIISMEYLNNSYLFVRLTDSMRKLILRQNCKWLSKTA